MQFDLGQENLSTRVAEYIKDYLLFSGRFGNGQKVTEHEVARALGISRSPIREAFKELHNEGLLEFKPRKGSFVVELSDQDVRELYLLRFWIESRLYEVIIQRKTLTQEKYDEVFKLVQKIENIVESDLDHHKKTIEYSRCALEIHTGLWSLLNMKWAVQVLTRLHNQMRLAMIQDLDYAPDLRKNALLHYEILDALKNDQYEEAVRALREDMKLYMNGIL
ncbi:MAG: GntR family transcriptional regulator [Synergistales bacterium]|nr:GntR family transcriptional regulator [Synergistales bacterium]